VSNIAEQFNNAHEDLTRTIYRAIGSRRAYTRDDISERSGIHRNTLARFLNGGNLALATLVELATAIDSLEYDTDPTRYINEAIEQRRARA